MSCNPIAAKNLREFFSANGVTQPIDLSTSESPVGDLRGTVQKMFPEFGKAEPPLLIENLRVSDQFKTCRLFSSSVFDLMASQDGEDSLSEYDVALSLERARLLKLPQGQNVSYLWRSLDSIKWELEHREYYVHKVVPRELNRYLQRNPTDQGRREVLEVLESLAGVRTQFGYFTEVESFYDEPMEEITKSILASTDPSIRARYFNLFGVLNAGYYLAAHESVLSAFEYSANDFEPILEKIHRGDLDAIQRILENSDPYKVVFGLLLAKRVMRAGEFETASRKVAAREENASQVVFRFENTNWRSLTHGQEINVALAQLASALRPQRNKPTCSGCGG